jgi:rubrerythrin
MKLFNHGYEMTLNRVYDTITIKEGSEKLKLTVNGDSQRMVAGLNKAQKKMTELSDDADDETVKEVAEYFAAVIFGKEQATELMKFYADDPVCVINVCGQYFKERLAGKIAAVQKKMKP